jgi:hypothetical protein
MIAAITQAEPARKVNRPLVYPADRLLPLDHLRD